ncbi:MAG: DUF1080 domain-containing protein [Verrucomicrobiales bacterium]
MKFLILLFLAIVLGSSCRPTTQSENPLAEREEEVWREVFAAEERGHWEKVDYGNPEMVGWEGERLRLEMGAELIGAKWTGELPQAPYELEFAARRMNGSDFFGALTFPLRRDDELVTLVLGGWGGGVVGISSIDGKDAAENETTTYLAFEKEKWYRVRLRVEVNSLRAWIDEALVVELSLDGREFSLRPGPIELCAPLGVAAWQTGAELRGLRWRPLAD